MIIFLPSEKSDVQLSSSEGTTTKESFFFFLDKTKAWAEHSLLINLARSKSMIENDSEIVKNIRFFIFFSPRVENDCRCFRRECYNEKVCRRQYFSLGDSSV